MLPGQKELRCVRVTGNAYSCYQRNPNPAPRATTLPDTTRKPSTFCRRACSSPAAASVTPRAPKTLGLPRQQAAAAAAVKLTSGAQAQPCGRQEPELQSRERQAKGGKSEVAATPPLPDLTLPGPRVAWVPPPRLMQATTPSPTGASAVAVARGGGVRGGRSTGREGPERRSSSLTLRRRRRSRRCCRRLERPALRPWGCGTAWVRGGEWGRRRRCSGEMLARKD